MLHGTFRPLDSADSVLRCNGLPSEGKHHLWCSPSQVKLAPSAKFHVRSLTTSLPAINPDDLPPPPVPPLPPPSTTGTNVWRPTKLIPSFNGPSSPLRNQEWRVYANNNGKNGRWHKEKDSSLSRDEPLPLPMAYPGSSPDPQQVEDMENCNPEKQDCQDVLYQWTGKCSRCQGTGEVSYFRKKGREIICKCIPCMGLGYVHKMTRRKDIEIDDDLNGAL